MRIKSNDIRDRLSLEDLTETEYLILYGALLAAAGNIVHREDKYPNFLGTDIEEVRKFSKRFVELDSRLRNSN